MGVPTVQYGLGLHRSSGSASKDSLRPDCRSRRTWTPTMEQVIPRPRIAQSLRCRYNEGHREPGLARRWIWIVPRAPWRDHSRRHHKERVLCIPSTRSSRCLQSTMPIGGGTLRHLAVATHDSLFLGGDAPRRVGVMARITFYALRKALD